MAEGSQFELMVRFRFGTALHGKAPEKNRLITAHPDLFGETGYLCGRVIGAFWAGKLAFSLENKINEPAWRAKPSSYLIAVDDKMIPPDAQRAMAGATVVEVKGSHDIYVSQPRPVAKLIEETARGAKAAAM